MKRKVKHYADRHHVTVYVLMQMNRKELNVPIVVE